VPGRKVAQELLTAPRHGVVEHEDLGKLTFQVLSRIIIVWLLILLEVALEVLDLGILSVT
jgi:hypothetical protein